MSLSTEERFEQVLSNLTTRVAMVQPKMSERGAADLRESLKIDARQLFILWRDCKPRSELQGSLGGDDD